jgi:cobalt-zinc-cadmium efflux system protein
MAAVTGVKTIHDLHIWTISSGLDSLSSHVVVSRGMDRDRLLEQLSDLLRERFGIAHVTLQIVEEREDQVRLTLPKGSIR